MQYRMILMMERSKDRAQEYLSILSCRCARLDRLENRGMRAR